MRQLIAKRLTTREKLSRQAFRQRATSRMLRRVVTRSAFMLLLLCASSGYWLWKGGVLADWGKDIGARMLTASTGMGLSVQHVSIEGRRRTPLSAIERAMDVKQGDPLFAYNLPEMQARLQAIDWIEEARITRNLPDTLKIVLIERQPVALWREGERYFLVDRNGAIIHASDPKAYMHLPLVVGEGATTHLHDLLQMLLDEQALFPKVASVAWVGGRRWNVYFYNGLEVRLPEDQPEDAWHQLAELQVKEKILDRAVTSLDFRIGGKLYVGLQPEAVPEASTEVQPGVAPMVPAPVQPVSLGGKTKI
jgi:cell division protein FtsQ